MSATASGLGLLRSKLCKGDAFEPLDSQHQFVQGLLARLHTLHQHHKRYKHVGMFLGEILGALFLGGDHAVLKPKLRDERVKVIAEGCESKDGQILIDKLHGKQVKILESIDSRGCYESFTSNLKDKIQSAVIGSFEEQKKKWNAPLSRTLSGQTCH